MSQVPLLLLPGLLCDEWLWSAQVKALADVAEPHVADLTLDDTIERMAARALADAPPVFALAGLSMGGYVALEIMRQAPQRVLKLALLDTSAAPDNPNRAAERRRGVTSLRYGRFTGVTQTLLRQLVHASKLNTPVGAGVRAMADRVGGEAYLRQQHAIENRIDSRTALAEIQVPTLIGAGDSDVLTPMFHALEMHEGIAHSKLHVFRECGHLPPVEQPDETSAVLRRWLTGG